MKANFGKILKNIKDDVNFYASEYKNSNEILEIIMESLYFKEGSVSSLIEEFLVQKGLDVK